MIAAAIFSGGSTMLPLYFIAGWIAPDKPRELAATTRMSSKFWQGVRASPGPHRPRHPQPASATSTGGWPTSNTM